MIPELFILGIDGLGADVVLETDYLPNLKKQCESYEHGFVKSPNNLTNTNFPHPHTWPCWTTIWTGLPEEIHGIHMPDKNKGIVQTIVDQPYITLWEVLDQGKKKCILNRVQMTRGLTLKNGEVLFGGKNMYTEFFGITYSIRQQLDILKERWNGADVMAYYTIALDHWFHNAMNVDKALIFAFVDYLIEWCQMYIPAENFIVISDHGFDPDTREHTQNAFYFSRRLGGKLNFELTDIAGVILDHVEGSFSKRLGNKIDRAVFNLSEKEKTATLKQLAAMGYF